MPVEDDGRFEYKLNVQQGDHEDWMLDPLNPARAGDPFGENSVCRTWGYDRPEWSEPHGAPAGHDRTHRGRQPDLRPDPDRTDLSAGRLHAGPAYPLVVIHDGEDFMTYADLSVSLDNLIAAGDIPPVVAALVQTGDRMGEYPKGRRHARYLVNELLPAITAIYSISDRRRIASCWAPASAPSPRSPRRSAIPACSAGWC